MTLLKKNEQNPKVMKFSNIRLFFVGAHQLPKAAKGCQRRRLLFKLQLFKIIEMYKVPPAGKDSLIR